MWGTRGSSLHDSNTHATLTFFISADSVSTYTAFTNQRQFDTGVPLVLIQNTDEFSCFSPIFILTYSYPNKDFDVSVLSYEDCVILYNHLDFTVLGQECWRPLPCSLTFCFLKLGCCLFLFLFSLVSPYLWKTCPYYQCNIIQGQKLKQTNTSTFLSFLEWYFLKPLSGNIEHLLTSNGSATGLSCDAEI